MSAPETLALYHYPSCGYCRWVRNVIAQLGIEVELRDIFEDRRHMEDLIAARGRRTVPVLRREQPDGNVDWMGESRDIVAYLTEAYGRE
jgi:glutathione S-transferase